MKSRPRGQNIPAGGLVGSSRTDGRLDVSKRAGVPAEEFGLP